mmetsp:Transcript_94441/g.252678  ORF Transcript_94441/g.252678 Transcript_94441/m.252678 type:complete len:109 (+) Transcript_94441:162-488(+)
MESPMCLPTGAQNILETRAPEVLEKEGGLGVRPDCEGPIAYQAEEALVRTTRGIRVRGRFNKGVITLERGSLDDFAEIVGISVPVLSEMEPDPRELKRILELEAGRPG